MDQEKHSRLTRSSTRNQSISPDRSLPLDERIRDPKLRTKFDAFLNDVSLENEEQDQSSNVEKDRELVGSHIAPINQKPGDFAVDVVTDDKGSFSLVEPTIPSKHSYQVQREEGTGDVANSTLAMKPTGNMQKLGINQTKSTVNAGPNPQKASKSITAALQPTPAKTSSNDWDNWDDTPTSTAVPAKSLPQHNATATDDDWDTPVANLPAFKQSTSNSKQISKSNDGLDDDWNTPASNTANPITSKTTSAKSNDGWDEGWDSPAASTALKTNDSWKSSNVDDWGSGQTSTTQQQGWGGSSGGGNDGWGRGSRGGGFGRDYGRGRGGGGGRGGRVPREPRADDWICSNSSCGFSNFSTRWRCFKCNTNKPAHNGGGGGEGNQSWNNHRRGGIYNANTNKSEETSPDWSSWSTPTKSRNQASINEPWGNVPSAPAVPSQGASDEMEIKHKEKKHSKPAKKKKKRSSSSSSSSSSSDGHSRKRKKRKHKHRKKSKKISKVKIVSAFSYSQDPSFVEHIQQPLEFPDEPIESVTGHSNGVDAIAQTAILAKSDNTLDIHSAAEKGLPLSDRFAAVSQNEGGGVGILGTLLVSTKAATLKAQMPTRRVQPISGSVLVPTIRGKVGIPQTQFRVTLSNVLVELDDVDVDAKIQPNLTESLNGSKAGEKQRPNVHAKVPSIVTKDVVSGCANMAKNKIPEATNEPKWLRDPIPETKTPPSGLYTTDDLESTRSSPGNLVIALSPVMPPPETKELIIVDAQKHTAPSLEKDDSDSDDWWY